MARFGRGAELYAGSARLAKARARRCFLIENFGCGYFPSPGRVPSHGQAFHFFEALSKRLVFLDRAALQLVDKVSAGSGWASSITVR